MFRVFLGLGSNLGDRVSYISNAVREISEIDAIRSVSSLYETEPVGYKNQPGFLNLVIEIETALKPPELLKQLQAIEKRVGRTNQAHLRPREIDIDILLYEKLVYENHDLIVPHPELQNRRFVLEPLCEISSDVIHPTLHESIGSLLNRCPDTSQVVRSPVSLPIEL